MTFEARVATYKAAPDDCWEWPGNKSKTGYGKCGVTVKGERYIAPHRAAYALLIGPIPDGAELDHLCRNRACFNPKHLGLVDHRTNVLRGEGPAAMHARQDECARGHALVPKSGKYGKPPFNHRYCPKCARVTGRVAVKRHRAKAMREDPVGYAAARKRWRNPEKEKECDRRRRADPVKSAKRRARDRERYATDEAYRESKIQGAREYAAKQRMAHGETR